MIQTLISITIAATMILGALNTPAHWYNVNTWFTGNLGALSLTDITSATQISAFPAIQTANNTLIETEINNLTASTTNTSLTTANSLTSASSLATIGTITSGTWNADTITPSYGGTGSTTLSANQVLLGNGTGDVITVSGWGTSGQVLSSNGGTAAPSWTTTSVNTTINYGWSGFHNFSSGVDLTGTTSIAASVATPFTLNGLNYSFPLSHVATSSVLSNDGSGALSFRRWVVLDVQPYANQTTTATATTTLATTVLPANLLDSSRGTIRIYADSYTQGSGGDCYLEVGFGSGSATSTVAYAHSDGGGTFGRIEANLHATSTSNQYATATTYGGDPLTTVGNPTERQQLSFHVVDVTSQSYISYAMKRTASVTCELVGYTVEYLAE